MTVLQDVKKILGIHPDDTSYDFDVVTHIATAFSVLAQAGVGDAEGFTVGEDTEWVDLYEDPSLNLIRTYVYLYVRMIFDPPANSFATTAMKEQLTELLHRINTRCEELARPYHEEVVLNVE